MTNEHTALPTKAVIYCRVSSKKQEKDDGLASQEAHCREYAAARGYKVVEVFNEKISGSLANRPAMGSLLNYLRAHKAEGRVVIIDSITRFARDVVAHWHLRDALKKAGGILQSPSLEFGESSHDRFVETVLAGGAQYQREINAEQTRDRMRARVQNGYWPFAAPVGYKHEKLEDHKGKVLVRDEPLASIVKEALEAYASGRFQLQAEVKRFLESKSAFPKTNGYVRYQFVTDILRNPVYAGYVEARAWKIPLRGGHHEPLISVKTFTRIQERLTENAYAPARADINADFPLRGTIACAGCGKALTACWAASSTGKKHPYYMCFSKDCERRRKSIRREKIEGDFERELARIQPTRKLVEVAARMFKDAWDQRASQAAAMAKNCEKQVAQIQKQIETFLGRLLDANSDSVIKTYENRIAELEREKLAAMASTVAMPRAGLFEQLFERALLFLAQPAKLWNSGDLVQKKLVLRLTFSDLLSYCPEKGFRTLKTTLPFKVLESVHSGDYDLALPKGVEPFFPE